MPKKKEQKDFWKVESLNYFKRNYAGKNIRELPVSPYLSLIFERFPIMIEDGSILEIGCGAANNLFNLCKTLAVHRAVGTETSLKVVEELRKVYPEMEFYECDSQHLPFETGEFDMVIFRSVLHWIDRNYLLQSIGEAMRVTSKYLVISDFAPLHPYSVRYSHKPEYLTFKMNYNPLIEASGLMRCLASSCFNDRNEWNAIQTSLWRKLSLDEAFPLQEKADFD